MGITTTTIRKDTSIMFLGVVVQYKSTQGFGFAVREGDDPKRRGSGVFFHINEGQHFVEGNHGPMFSGDRKDDEGRYVHAPKIGDRIVFTVTPTERSDRAVPWGPAHEFEKIAANMGIDPTNFLETYRPPTGNKQSRAPRQGNPPPANRQSSGKPRSKSRKSGNSQGSRRW